MDIKSNPNVTHPAVFESDEMKLRHKRAGKHEVPRRFIQQTVVGWLLSMVLFVDFVIEYSFPTCRSEHVVDGGR